MSALLITLWPGHPVAILAIEYRPPVRAARVAPPSLRLPMLGTDALAQLAETTAALADRVKP